MLGVGILGGRRMLFFLGQDLDALERGGSGPAPGLGGGTAAASQQGKGQRTAQQGGAEQDARDAQEHAAPGPAVVRDEAEARRFDDSLPPMEKKRLPC